MPTYIYYIIGIGFLLAIYFAFMLKKSNQRKSKHLEEFNKRYSGKSLSHEQKRAMAKGALMAWMRDEEVDSLELKKAKDEYAIGLKNQWGISNRTEAMETLSDLLQLKKSQQIDALIYNSPEKLKSVYQTVKNVTKLPADLVNSVRTTYAWDTCRAINFAKWSFWCGYLSEQEAITHIEKASKIAEELGRNWEEYTTSFLLGRTIQSFDIEPFTVYTSLLLKGERSDAKVFKQYSFK